VRSRLRSKMRSRGLLLCLLLLLTASGSVTHRGAASAGEVGPECGRGVSGPGFHVFACMSGGAAAGHPHPKELLIVRRDGPSVAYPAWRVGPLAVGGGEVVAGYDDKLVRVTSRRLVPLVTRQGLASALHRRAVLIMGFKNMKVDARGDLYFFVSTLIRGRYGCQNRSLERLRGGRIRQIWASSSPPNNICY
jgi:hypothetical protein